MRRWIESLPLRWLVFLLTTWCLNSDAIEAALTHDSGRAASAAALVAAPNRTTTMSALHLVGSHELRAQARCDCHRGTVLPAGRTAAAWMKLPSFAAPLGDFERHPSVTLAPDLPPPRL